jgi:sulfotransferase family protein
MSLAPDELVEAAEEETGLTDFGSDSFREGLLRLTTALTEEAGLSELGAEIMRMRLTGLLSARLRVVDTVLRHPEIAEERVVAPMFVIGLPRTGTTALSNLLHADPGIRSLRMWESASPVPPPESATEDSDPRIAEAAAGLEAMYSAFPKMRSLHFQSPTGPTECQDLLGMEFRTSHFDGMAIVPSYTRWVLDCDMTPAYLMHRRTLQLLQWHCPPHQWHLKTPVHMLSLPALHSVYPDARFIWTHRDPSEVMGSVCSLIDYTRSWVSEQPSVGIGTEQTAIWSEALRRAMEFRDGLGEDQFVDVGFRSFNEDPVGTVRHCFEKFGIPYGPRSEDALEAWSAAHRRGQDGAHEFALGDFGLTAEGVRGAFGFYLERFAEMATGGAA